MNRSRWPVALAGATAFALAGTALAFVRTTPSNGMCLWWASRNVPYAVNDFGSSAPASPATDVCGVPTSPTAVLAAVKASFAAWSQPALACTDLQLTYQGQTPSVQTGNDGQNLVVFRRGPCSDTRIVPGGDPCLTSGTCADAYNCWDHSGSSIIALTTTTYRPSTGEIIDADIELNAWDGNPGTFGNAVGFYFTCVDPSPGTVTSCPATPSNCCSAPGVSGCLAMDVQNTVTHEAGHFIGLGHTPVSGATMFASAARGETSKRSLAQDDIDGVCAIYPAGKPTVTCVSHSSGCGQGSAGPGSLLGLLALLALRWRLSKSPAAHRIRSPRA